MILNSINELNKLTENKDFHKFIQEVDGITVLFKDGSKTKIKTYQYQISFEPVYNNTKKS